MQNQKKLEQISKALLIEIGENPNRTGLKDTPKRMAKMFMEIFKGYDKKQMPKITVFPNNDDGIVYDQILGDTGDVSAFCEHHMALFQGKYYFGYIPDKQIIGLSKIARIVDYFSSRMQVQERLGYDIVDYIDKKIKPKGIILIIKAHHSCKEIRGIKSKGVMTTSIVRGIFTTNPSAKQEFLSLINLK